MKKINIWSSEVNLDEWKEYLLEEYPEMDVNDEYIFEKASELNYCWGWAADQALDAECLGTGFTCDITYDTLEV